MTLLGLLRLLAPKVLTHIRRLNRLLRQALDCKPSLPHSRRRALVRDERIAPLPRLRNGPLYKDTLTVPRAEEDRIEQEQGPATLGKGERRQEHTEPEQDFQGRNERHAGVIVLFHEAANGIGEWRAGLGATTRGSLRSRGFGR